jgi:5-methylcytosine-specific restriction enzyme subunit McrC
MAVKVPIQNIYYLLAYAWDYFQEGDEADLLALSCPDIHNLLSSMLCRGIRQLATRGVDKTYEGQIEETSRLRGRMDVAGSYRKMLHLSARMICEFDELTADTLINRILRAMLEQLRKNSELLSRENQSEVRHAIDLLRDVSMIPLSAHSFNRVQIHRNNRHYRLLLSICRLLFESFVPAEKSGKRRFRSLLENDDAMERIFERFVLRFAQRHCVGAKVWPMKIKWATEGSTEAERFLPQMRTDVTIEYAERKTILDCKFYAAAFQTRFDREKLHSSHLYQLFAYLQNKARDDGWEETVGILLYPAVSHEFHLSSRILGHEMRVESINLDKPWPEIHKQLLSILRPELVPDRSPQQH